MNKTQWIAMLMLGVAVVALPQTGFAQSNVAILDMGLVFEKHAEFQLQLQELRQQAETLQRTVLQQRQKLQEDLESLNVMFSPDKPEYKQREKEIAQQMTLLDVDAREKVRELTIREAHIHYDTYNEVSRYIEDYCLKNDIRLVMRYTGGEMKANDPESIMQQINGAVVFFRPEKDITNAIVQLMASAKSDVTKR